MHEHHQENWKTQWCSVVLSSMQNAAETLRIAYFQEKEVTQAKTQGESK